MRCFIAIDIEQHIRDALAKLQDELAAAAALKRKEAKWVAPEAIHLTLRFLGEVADPQIPQICRLLEAIADRHKSFSIDVQSVGSFGGKNPRVLWVGAGLQSSNLRQLQKDLEEGLIDLGWPKEAKEFTGHLTLCRIKTAAAGRSLLQVIQPYATIDLGQMTVEAVCLYQSQLTPTGPIYTLLCKYPLRR